MRRVARVRPLTAIGVAAATALLVACGGEEQQASPVAKPAPSKPAASAPTPAPTPPPPSPPLDPAQLAERGRSIYMSNCIACHNVDPSADGALGPAVTGSSEALIYARVVDGTYPEGYTPKRDTRVMIALPHLKPEIPALAAYLDK